MSQQIAEAMKAQRYELWCKGFLPAYKLTADEKLTFPMRSREEQKAAAEKKK